MSTDPDDDDDGAPIPTGNRMTDRERARTWARLNHAEKPWTITDTEYPLPKDWTS